MVMCVAKTGAIETCSYQAQKLFTLKRVVLFDRETGKTVEEDKVMPTRPASIPPARVD